MDEMLYHIGDRVRIVDEANSDRWDSDGDMEEDWCGHVMTIAEVCDGYYYMEEDDNGWSWYPEMIAGLVSSAVPPTPAKEPQKYKAGDRVQITHTMSGPHWSSGMKGWLGITMTIARVEDGDHYRMEEDDEEWIWSPHMIVGLSSAPATRRYKVGDCVQIVSQKCGSNWSDRMLNCWLGHVMTIREVCGTKYRMEEDRDEHRGNGWEWYSYMIAGLETEFSFEPATDDELMRLLS